MKINHEYHNHIIGKGMYFSEDTCATNTNNNVLLLGGSGSGKTGSYIVPNIQNIETSFVCSDTKGQLYNMFADKLIRRGYHVYKLDFVNSRRSNAYNPLWYIQRYDDSANGAYSENDVRTIAHNLWPFTNDRDPIWDNCTRDYLMFLISYCLETEPKEQQNLCRVAQLHGELSSLNGKAALLAYLQEHSDDNGTFASRLYNNISMSMSAEKMFSSIMGFVNTSLAPFISEDSKVIFGNKGAEEFYISSLGITKTALFINVSDTDESMDRVINLFYGQAMQVLCRQANHNPDGKLTVPVRFFLDDFAASAKIANFTKMISVIRSRDIYVSIILQDKNQLEAMYSHAEASTIMNNCDHIIYYGGNDISTAQYVSARTCKTIETIIGKQSKDIWIITNGSKPVLAEKIPPYSTLKTDEFDKS
jgi:type IV secretion system protein VirD4